jgi:beta-lactam-binding protein with PASTA domain
MKKLLILLVVVFMFSVSCATFVINVGSGKMMDNTDNAQTSTEKTE